MESIRAPATIRGGIDMPALTASLRRALPVLLVIAALVGAVAFLMTERLVPLYRAFTDVSVTVNAAGAAAERALNGEVQLIRSRDVAEQVAVALDLASAPEYRAVVDGTAPLHGLLTTLGLARDLSGLSPEERVIAAYGDNLTVEATGGAGIRVGFWSADPVLAARGADAVAAAYVALRQSATDEAAALAAEIVRLRDAIAAAEARAAELKTSMAEMPAPLDDAMRAALLAERAEAAASAETAGADASAIRAALAAGALPDTGAFIADPGVRTLLDEQARLRAAMADELVASPLGNPRIIEIGTRLGEIGGALAEAAVGIAEALEADAGRYEARIAAIDAAIADGDASAAAARELDRLAEAIAADNGRLDAAVNRQAGLGQGGALPARVEIVRDAVVPAAPAWPDAITVTLVAFAAALLAGAGIAVLRDIVSGAAFRRTAFAPLSDLDLPAQAEGRMRRVDGEDVSRSGPAGPRLAPGIESEVSLGDIADSIAGRRRIIVTLAEESDAEGRPLAAVALARALSGRDRSVVLVDLHDDGANETAMGEAEDLVGFSDLLDGDASFSQSIFRDRRSRSHFIPAGSRPLAPEALAGERLATLLTALDHTYDHVVIDCPDGAVARIAPGADAALVASEHGTADPRTVRAVARVARVSDARVYQLTVEPARPPPETAEAA